MGIFEKFRKKQKETDLKEIENIKQKDFEVEYNMSDDGKLQIDFYDKKIKFGQDYDTTRLIVSNRPIILAGEEVSNCAVSWYNQSDVVFNDPQYCNESIDARDYKGILAQIDTALLQKDENYCSAVMRKLLNKSRVNKYIEDGLQEHPEHPCGKYIGGIKTEDGYSKFFSMQVGKASHNSNLMVNRRKEYDERIWKKQGDHYVGTPTEIKLPLPKWEVNAEGKVPSYFGPGPEDRCKWWNELPTK